MKNFFSYLKRVSALALLAIGFCTVSCGDDGEGDKKPATLPIAGLSAGNATETTLSFVLGPQHATEVYYLVLSADAEAPATAEQLFDVETWGSRAADPAQPALYTWEGLSPDTAYKVFAAAKNEAGYSGLGVLDMQTTEQLEARVGDFYYSDGTWSTELDPNKTPIAIVVFKGLAAEYDDHLEYYKDREGNPMTKVNGYAVALWDATWMEGEDYPQGWTVWENQEYCGTSIMGTADDIDFRGYDNTQKIKAKAEELFGTLSPVEENYPACYYASVNYEYICPSPAKSSGWFFPSAYQLKHLYSYSYFDDGNVIGCFEKSMNKLIEAYGEEAVQPMWRPGAMYWTSTEQLDAYGKSYRAIYMTFASDYVYTGSLAWENKNSRNSVRSMIVF